MANAEADLYAKWKEMTLNSGGEETKYENDKFYFRKIVTFDCSDTEFGITQSESSTPTFTRSSKTPEW